MNKLFLLNYLIELSPFIFIQQMYFVSKAKRQIFFARKRSGSGSYNYAKEIDSIDFST